MEVEGGKKFQGNDVEEIYKPWDWNWHGLDASWENVCERNLWRFLFKIVLSLGGAPGWKKNARHDKF